MIYRVSEQDIRIFTPLDELTLYEWGTFTGKDYFCPACGILPFRRPSAPTQAELTAGVKPFDGWAVNVRCLNDFNIKAVTQTEIAASKL